VNIAVFLAQSMTESIIYDTCDELNTQHIPGNATDGIGLDDGLDQFRFPISNACGSNGRSYQNEQCKKIEDLQYDCAKQMNSEEFRLMEARATTFARWRGAPGPLYCGPKSIHGETGFWDSTMGMEMGEVSLANDDGRTGEFFQEVQCLNCNFQFPFLPDLIVTSLDRRGKLLLVGKR
jgi:hypothetical protein